MTRLLSITLFFCLLVKFAHSIPTNRPTETSPGEQCRAAISAAERGHAIPAQLMAAIGRVESGRRDPGTGAWGAWPWTINAEGQGFYFETKAEAVAAVRTLQARGVRSIDVGCMQVNLMHHPDAFPNLDLAFEPGVNADYAARFLTQLHAAAGDWNRATANYHSSNPSEGDPYAAKVAAVWPEEQRKAGLATIPLFGPGMAGPGMLAPGVPGPLVHGVPPMAGRQAGIFPTGGRLPEGMIRGDAARPGASSAVAPPGMMQGGTIPAGTLPPGAMAALARGGAMPPVGMSAAVSGAAPGAISGQALINPGRGLDFYRATPVGVTMGLRMASRVVNRFNVR
jgi:hypothetical protein